jgi:hypothetical protein
VPIEEPPITDSPRCNACGVRLNDQETGNCPSCGADLGFVRLYREPPSDLLRSALRGGLLVALVMGLAMWLRWWLQ